MDFFVPENHICVSKEGKVYQMLVLAEKTQILELLVCEDDGLIKNIDNGSNYSLLSDSGPFECVSGAPNYMELYIKTGSHVMIANGTISYSLGHGILPVYDSSVSEGRVTSRTIDLNDLESGYQRAILKTKRCQ